MSSNKYTLHPWHGVSQGENFPNELVAYIEITPFDTLKYEVDKESGLLKVDRPQKFSNIVPALYGFVPQTYCGRQIAELARSYGMECQVGDGDPLDILILSSHPISKNNLLLSAIPIGGLGLLDRGEADDKLIAVLKDDPIYSHYHNLSEVPSEIIEKMIHYFLTYKNLPSQPSVCKLTYQYDSAQALQVLEASKRDYIEKFINPY